jgi:methyl-accepting chemotaxis protein
MQNDLSSFCIRYSGRPPQVFCIYGYAAIVTDPPGRFADTGAHAVPLCLRALNRNAVSRVPLTCRSCFNCIAALHKTISALNRTAAALNQTIAALHSIVSALSRFAAMLHKTIAARRNFNLAMSRINTALHRIDSAPPRSVSALKRYIAALQNANSALSQTDSTARREGVLAHRSRAGASNDGGRVHPPIRRVRR